MEIDQRKRRNAYMRKWKREHKASAAAEASRGEDREGWPCGRLTCSLASGATPSALIALVSRRSRSAKAILGDASDSRNSFQRGQSMTTFAHSPESPLILSSAGRRASGQASLPLFTDTVTAKVSGPTCSASGSIWEQNGLSWSSRPETRHGKPKSVVIFPTLAATSPDLSSALATLVRRIFAGECSWLPAPACRDWRSPGSRSHPRLKASRGQQMPEVIGTRISSELYEWMLGLPAK